MKTSKILNLISLLFFTNVLTAQVDHSVIEVSKEEFTYLANWVNSKNPEPLDQVLLREKIFEKSKLKEIITKKAPSNTIAAKTTGEDCACYLVQTQFMNSVAPTQDNYKDDGVLHYDRRRNYEIRGAAKHHYLELDGGDMSVSQEYGLSVGSSITRSELNLNWVCLNNNLPSDCGCNKSIFLKSKYESKLKVSNEVGGIFSRGSFAKIEDAAVLFEYEVGSGSVENAIANGTVLESVRSMVSGYANTNWNPEFIINAGKLATAVLIGNASGAALQSQIETLIETPIHSKGGSNGNAYSKQETMTMLYDGVRTLKPNKPKTFSLISFDNAFVRGYGGNYIAKAEVYSDFALSYVLKFDHSGSACCYKKTGQWMLASFANSPSQNANLRQWVGAFIGLHAPWINNGNLPISWDMGGINGQENCCTSSVSAKLNNIENGPITVPETGDIKLNFINTVACSDNYFVSTQQCNSNGVPYGVENQKWMPTNLLNNYGGKGNFNVKQFNTTFNNFNFTLGNYYRVKIAVSEPWNEKTFLIKVCNPYLEYTLNGNSEYNVAATMNQSLIINLSKTISCSDNFLFSIQQADAAGNAFGPENVKWVNGSEIVQYGGKDNFNLKQFNQTFGTFNFQSEKYYRVKVAISEPWSERVTLLKMSN